MNGSIRSAKGWQTRKDKKALAAYEKELKDRRMEYAQVATAESMTGRRNQALAVGECVLQLMEKLRDLNRQERLLNGTLFWTIEEQKLKDTDGKKGFRYAVCWHVKSDQPYYSEDEITAEIEKTRQQMEAQRNEFFVDDEDDGPAEEDLTPPFEPDPTGYAEE